MKIRKYCNTDFEEVYKLNFVVSPDEDKEYLKRDINNAKTFFFVAEIEDKIVGVISYSFPYYNLCARINLVSIKEEYRGQKLGTLLIQFAIAELKEHNIRFITIDTALWDSKTINLYKKLGFKAVNVFSEYYGDNNDMVWLEMDIRK